MKKIVEEGKLPIKMWVEEIEDTAMEQALNLANYPFAFHHIALMPDAHSGYGMPIGGILATHDVIIPHAVGNDIGCGMCITRTSLTDISKGDLKKILGKIRKAIPVGHNKHKKAQLESLLPKIEDYDLDPKKSIVGQHYNNALKQVGTLGGGNHFIEIQKGSDGFIYIMVHSGSRNLGKQVADHYNKLAKEINAQEGPEIPDNWRLNYLPLDSPAGQDYLNEMNYCMDFAFANRKLMMNRIKDIFNEILKEKIRYDKFINIAHNYANAEEHFGEMVIVHRKGATQAFKDQLGLIPGSQGTSSYIVKGKGNPESFMSCSHGAGRVMSRAKAKKELNLEEEKKKLDEKGILHAIRGKHDLEEATSAYKPIDEVMENQKDLVDIDVELTPLAVVKG